ncbi:MAG: methylamine utilization protein [Thermoanaerobaculia bacterium]|nr:methylamine utilization protein [Thermoanaerobaculia bacterium]
MDQRDKAFVPHVLPITVGTGVVFENSDSIAHHVYSFSPPRRFDFYLSEGESREVVFQSPGVVALGCNVHDWMLAYVVVLETPYFTMTGTDGRAILGDLPPGDYRLQLWHPRIDRKERGIRRDLRIEAVGQETWRVTLERPLLPDRTGERAPEYGGAE